MKDWPRTAGALALAGGALALARLGGVGLWPSLLAAAAAAVFVLWRTVPGVLCGFAAFLAAATAAWPEGGRLGGLAVALPWAAALELFGLVTILAVWLVRDPRRVSRRLLGSFLASTGIGLLGVALCAGARTGALGSALVAAALGYRLGAVPVYAWLPMLLRHPSRGIEALGALGVAAAGAVLALVLPLLPRPDAALLALGALSAVTIPWAARNAWRQRSSDPPDRKSTRLNSSHR